MRKTTYLLLLLQLCLIGAFGQSSKTPIKYRVILLSYNKTIHLVFEDEVKYVDAGLEDILWKKDGDMVKLAVKSENFEETNLVVKTTDNTMYGFVLRSVNNTDSLIYTIPSSEGISFKVKAASIQKATIDSLAVEKRETTAIEKSCLETIKRSQLIYESDEMQKDVFVALANIFVHNDKLFFSFTVINNSNINYDVDYFYLTIQDKKKIKKSSIQPLNIEPIYTQNKFDRLPAKATKNIVIVTDKFTVANKKKLFFEMKEKDGGRNFSFDIDENLIYKAPAL